MKNKSFIIIFLVLCILFIMSGCDGSSSSSDDPAGIVGSKYSSVPEDRSGVSVGDIVFADKKPVLRQTTKQMLLHMQKLVMLWV